MKLGGHSIIYIIKYDHYTTIMTSKYCDKSKFKLQIYKSLNKYEYIFEESSRDQ